MTRKAIYPGSFDPITNGHLDILDRALSLFSEVTIVVAGTDKKNPLFTAEERVALIREVTRDRPGVKVDRWSGLIMDYARTHHVSAVIRGLRAASDFEYEFMMANMNRKLAPSIETVFMMTGEGSFYISSQNIREAASLGGNVEGMVPPGVLLKLRERFQAGKG